jgi:hypothetical protein
LVNGQEFPTSQPNWGGTTDSAFVPYGMDAFCINRSLNHQC